MGNGTETVFFELIRGVRLNVGINDFYEIVPVSSTLLMEKSRTVHELVNNGAHLNTSGIQGHRLSASGPAHQRIASIIGVYVNIICMFRFITGYKSNACFFAIFFERLGYNLLTVRTVLTGQNVRYLPVGPPSPLIFDCSSCETVAVVYEFMNIST
jgi:hypothetical protein